MILNLICELWIKLKLRKFKSYQYIDIERERREKINPSLVNKLLNLYSWEFKLKNANIIKTHRT